MSTTRRTLLAVTALLLSGCPHPAAFRILGNTTVNVSGCGNISRVPGDEFKIKVGIIPKGGQIISQGFEGKGALNHYQPPPNQRLVDGWYNIDVTGWNTDTIPDRIEIVEMLPVMLAGSSEKTMCGARQDGTPACGDPATACKVVPGGFSNYKSALERDTTQHGVVYKVKDVSLTVCECQR